MGATILNRKVRKGRLGDVEFQLNPTTMDVENGNNWTFIESPGMEQAIPMRTTGKPLTYSFELYMNSDHMNHCDVNGCLEKLNRYRKSSEPVIFAWGRMALRAVITDCKVQVLAWNKELGIKEVKVPITLAIIRT